MKKVRISGPLTLYDCQDYIEDIINTESYTMISYGIIHYCNNLFHAHVCYEENEIAKKSTRKVVK